MWKQHFWGVVSTSSYGDSVGEGAPSLLWVRLLATDPVPSTWDAGLLAADSHTSPGKSPFLNRIVKEKEGCLCLSYKSAMI